MKELSIEEKAKRYDKAIEVAQRFYNNSVAITKKGLEDILPELAESEGERIRKELITFFQRFPYERISNAGTKVKEAIAWLEKQGEQNPTEWKGEDYGIYKSIIDDAVDRDLALTATQKEWIRNLKPQPKQKWSEEAKSKQDK